MFIEISLKMERSLGKGNAARAHSHGADELLLRNRLRAGIIQALGACWCLRGLWMRLPAKQCGDMLPNARGKRKELSTYDRWGKQTQGERREGGARTILFQNSQFRSAMPMSLALDEAATAKPLCHLIRG